MNITVYTKPACVQCNATYRALDKAGIEYAVVDISEDPEARDYVMALGYLQAPSSWRARITGRASVPIASRLSRSLPDPTRIAAAETALYDGPAFVIDRKVGEYR